MNQPQQFIVEIVDIPWYERASNGVRQLFLGLCNGLCALALTPFNVVAAIAISKKEMVRPINPGQSEPQQLNVNHTHHVESGDDDEDWMKEHKRRFNEDD